jgi:hypothetical protein
MADEGFAADEGEVDRVVALNQIEDAVDQIVATEIGKVAELGFAAEMRIAVGIASGTAQGTFASYFNREKRDFPAKDFAPGPHDVKRVPTRETRLFWLKGCYLRGSGFGIYFWRTTNKDCPNGGVMRDSRREEMGTM